MENHPYKLKDEKMIEAFIAKLKPVKNWSEIAEGTKIFTPESNHPSYYDVFQRLEEDYGVVGVRYISSVTGVSHWLAEPNWYFWDEAAAEKTIREIPYDPFGQTKRRLEQL